MFACRRRLALLHQPGILKRKGRLGCNGFNKIALLGRPFIFPGYLFGSVPFGLLLTRLAGLGDIRSGIRFSNLENQRPIRQQNDYNHTVLCAARIGLHMMQNLGPDFIPTKYSLAQKQVCAELGLKPTPCMHIALADQPGWDSYIIDGTYHRVGIRNLVKARLGGEV